MLSWGRSTYGGLGRASADAQSDTAAPEPQLVDGLGGAAVIDIAAGAASIFHVYIMRTQTCTGAYHSS